MQAFVSYYSYLYSAIPPYDHQILADLLGPLQIQELPDEVVASLEVPFTDKELPPFPMVNHQDLTGCQQSDTNTYL